jgi:MoaA/NifB/PqqE/SkfB family radical SAM enzyme
MIFFKTGPQSDPYYDLWHSPEWLFPFDNKDKLIFPKILTVEPTNICQNKCIYCSTRLMNRPSGFMSLELMEKIANEARQYGASIRFGGFGEPLIHKDFVEMVRFCKEKGVRTTVFTNCKLLDEEMMAAFCRCGLDEIRFSGSGVDAGTHNEIRKNSDYEKDFKEKIIMAYEVREKLNASRPFFAIYTNVFDYDAPEFEDLKDEYVSFFLRYVDKIDIDLTNLSRVKDMDEVRRYYPAHTINQVYKPCVTLYHKFIIHWNGDVFACDIPYNFESGYFLGNIGIEGTSLYDMYRCEKIKRLREKTQNL